MFNQYPYLNIQDLNLDYILKAIREMRYEVTNFVSINAIKYADPIQWNITTQYEKNTIVIDPVTGTAYISVAPVPAGVALTRPEYWTVVFDLGSFVTRAAQNFTDHWESETTTTATFPSSTGDWLVWGDVLYKALSNIIAGDTYVVGSNIEHFTIEDLYNAYLNTIANILSMIGDVTDLATSDTSNIVNAINSVLNDLNLRIDGVVETIDNLTFDTVADMQAAALNEGDMCRTSGYYSALDGGGADFVVVPSIVAGTHCILLDNGLYAALMLNDVVTVEQFGAYGDGTHDDAAALNEAFTHPHVLLSNKTYRITEPLEITSNFVEGDNSQIFVDYSTWKYNAVHVSSVGDVRISGLHVDANEMAGRGIILDNGNVFKLVSVTNCKVENTNNKSSALNSMGICVDCESETVTIANCVIKNIKKESSNQGVNASVGIAVHDINGTVNVTNNIIDGVYYNVGEEYDADGIALYAKTANDNNPELTSICANNNLVLNCQGRFFKIKSDNTKIVNNTCRNENLAIIAEFRGVDLQRGGGEIGNNIFKIANCTGGGNAKFVKVSDYDYNKAIVSTSIHDNSFYCDVSAVMNSAVEIRCPDATPLTCNVEGNFVQNVKYVVDVLASVNITVSASEYVFVNNNAVAGTYTLINHANSRALPYTKFFVNSNCGENTTNLRHEALTVDASVAAGAPVADDILSQIQIIGVTIGVATWKTHGTGLYIVMRSGVNRAVSIWYYSGSFFIADNVAAGVTNHYRIDGTSI